jgi:hypothetical protein
VIVVTISPASTFSPLFPCIFSPFSLTFDVIDQDQFKRGLEQFNGGYFFECHDTLEEIWMETSGHDRLFLQGLIQVSVGFYHLLNRNFKGAASQFRKGISKLDQYRPSHRGVELEKFLEAIGGWRAVAEEGVGGIPVVLDEGRIPKITYSEKENISWRR